MDISEIKRATRYGLVAYLIIFIIGSISSIISKQVLATVIMPLVILGVALFYLKKTRATVTKGLILGAYWMLLALLLDIIIIVYGLGVGWDFFLNSSWTLILGYSEYIIFGGVAPLIKRFYYRKK